jgi:hypothetical protein
MAGWGGACPLGLHVDPPTNSLPQSRLRGCHPSGAKEAERESGQLTTMLWGYLSQRRDKRLAETHLRVTLGLLSPAQAGSSGDKRRGCPLLLLQPGLVTHRPQVALEHSTSGVLRKRLFLRPMAGPGASGQLSP